MGVLGLKAVFFDLDDTLLHDDLTLSAYSVSVFRKLHENHVALIAASGRAQQSMLPYVEQIGCIDMYIACNGAEIWDGNTHCLLCRELFPVETALRIAQFAESHDCYAHVYEEDRFCYNRHCIYAERYSASARLKGCYVGKLSEYIHEPRNKILFIDEIPKIASLYEEAATVFDGIASVTCSKPFYLEFNPVRATKGIALSSVCSLSGFREEDCIAIGDSLNDFSMLKKAGLSVLVSNGCEEIAPLCDYVCGTNNEDGPARFLNEYFFRGEVVS